MIRVSPFRPVLIRAIVPGAALLIAAVLAPGNASAQENGSAGPSPSMIGPVAPLATAAVVPSPSPYYAVQAAHYIAGQVAQDLPPGLLHGAPDLDSAFVVGDEPGPAALLIPSRDLSPALLAAVPPADARTAGMPVAWLALRYGTIIGPDGQVPDERLAHVVLPGPFRMTFVPLTVTQDGAGLALNLLGKDGAVLVSTPLAPGPPADHASLSLGAISNAPTGRTVQIVLPGHTASIQVGAPPASALMPRPLEGNLHIGDLAPDFSLKPAKGDGLIRLADARGKQPTVLVFGSFT
ncbi:MAG: hypothetical protein LC772_11910 [Chloroflexi bacterium]|nr:hypothetical protein [Chloroflexota bacterium]